MNKKTSGKKAEEYSKDLRQFIDHVSEYNLDFQGITLDCLNKRSISGDCLLHALVRRWSDWAGDGNLVKELLDNGVEINAKGDLGFTPLHFACLKGNLAAVETLVLYGADLHIENETGGKPIDVAALHKHERIIEFLKQYEVDRKKDEIKPKRIPPPPLK